MLYGVNASEFLLFSKPLASIQFEIYAFLAARPYLWPVWNFIPPLETQRPMTWLTDGWIVLISLQVLAGHLLHRKVKEDIMPSSIIVHGSIGVVNTGKMGIRQVESIAAHLNRISSPEEDRAANAIAVLTKAVIEAPDLDASKRRELLDQFVELARQTALPPKDRSTGVSRAIVGALDTTLNAAGNLAAIWATCGETIKRVLGI
jgi:hypothetical protein